MGGKTQKIKGILIDTITILKQSSAKSLIIGNLYSEYLHSVSGVVSITTFLAIYHYVLDFRETAVRNEKPFFSEHVAYVGLVNAEQISTKRGVLLLA